LQIKELVGLERNFRLKKLYAHENQILTISESAIKQLKYLQVLTLHGNQISDLKATVAQLVPLNELKELSKTLL
jgi:Leucine-rich repeat (LRR) protein